MSKREETLIRLEMALDRIVKGEVKNIPNTKKLSVRAVELEAKLGDGSIYYYPEFVDKVKQVKKEIAESQGVMIKPRADQLQDKLSKEKRSKENLKDKYTKASEKLASFTSHNFHMDDHWVKENEKVKRLERENQKLKEENHMLRRDNISVIK